MSNFSDFIGGGGGATLETVILTKSQTWTPPVNGTGIIHVIGAGGSGSGSTARLAGGAGGYSRKAVTFSTGTNWTIVVGAGGLPTTLNAAGVNGGNSTAKITVEFFHKDTEEYHKLTSAHSIAGNDTYHILNADRFHLHAGDKIVCSKDAGTLDATLSCKEYFNPTR